MADLPHVICFRVGPELRDKLKSLAGHNHRKLGDVVRLLLEWAIEKWAQERIREELEKEQP